MWKSWINSRLLHSRQMEAQDLEELNIDELQKLEDEIEGGLSLVLQTKDESITSQILALETNVSKLNQLIIRGRVTDPYIKLGEHFCIDCIQTWMLSNGASGVALESEISSAEESMSSESATSATSCFSSGPSTSALDDDDSDDTFSLKLELPHHG